MERRREKSRENNEKSREKSRKSIVCRHCKGIPVLDLGEWVAVYTGGLEFKILAKEKVNSERVKSMRRRVSISSIYLDRSNEPLTVYTMRNFLAKAVVEGIPHRAQGEQGEKILWLVREILSNNNPEVSKFIQELYMKIGGQYRYY